MSCQDFIPWILATFSPSIDSKPAPETCNRTVWNFFSSTLVPDLELRGRALLRLAAEETDRVRGTSRMRWLKRGVSEMLWDFCKDSGQSARSGGGKKAPKARGSHLPTGNLRQRADFIRYSLTHPEDFRNALSRSRTPRISLLRAQR